MSIPVVVFVEHAHKKVTIALIDMQILLSLSVENRT